MFRRVRINSRYENPVALTRPLRFAPPLAARDPRVCAGAVAEARFQGARRRRLPPVAGWLRIRPEWPRGGRAGVRALGSRGRRDCGVDLAAAIGTMEAPRGGARRRRWRSCDRGCRLRLADSSFVFGRGPARSPSAAGGAGRHTTKSLPMCWTGAASSSAQIRESTASRASRSSLNTRTLMSSCASRLTSISCSTPAVSPCWPTLTTGRNRCALERRSRRSAGVRESIARV